jgi:hypothetical protein
MTQTNIIGRAYGNSVEPGGMDLTETIEDIQCPCCGDQAKERTWQVAEGALNTYTEKYCKHCAWHEPDPFDPRY